MTSCPTRVIVAAAGPLSQLAGPFRPSSLFLHALCNAIIVDYAGPLNKTCQVVLYFACYEKALSRLLTNDPEIDS